MHQAPLNPSLKGKNVKVFKDLNPIAENGAPLFINSVPGNGPVNIKVNPAHPRAHFYKLLIDSLDQDPSGESFQAQFDPYLDAPSDGEQSSEKEEGRSPGLFTPPRSNEDTKIHGWDDEDNDPASHIYDDYGYRRYVSDFNINTKAHRQQLLVALGSLASSVEQYMPHSINCVKCKKKSGQGLIEMLADSGTSLNFTYDRSDLSEYQEISDEDFSVQTASKSPSLAVKGVGSMFLTISRGPKKRTKVTIWLYPVFYVPGINHRFLSVGTLLNQGLMLKGSSSSLEFRTQETNRLEFTCEPHEPGQTIYWLSVKLASADSLLAKSLICSVDYDIMHCCFGHPSKDVL